VHKCINLSHRNTSSYMLVIKYKATRKRVALTDTRIYARALEDTVLEDAIQQAANRFYLADTRYAAHYEPGGDEYISGALTEALLP